MIEHSVPTAKGDLHVAEQPGEGPAIVMTHGYPDDSRIYQRLLPELAGRHVVTFDFLGYGRSGRDAGWPLEPGQREGEKLRHGPADPQGVGMTAILPQFFGAADQPPATAAIRAWTAELFEDMRLQQAHLDAGDVARLEVPVTLAFGAEDPYFDAADLHEAFKSADVHVIPGAAHWPQWDRPGEIAALL